MATLTESDIQSEICAYLQKRGYLFWRMNNVPTFDKRLNNGYGGYRSQGKWTPKGLSDIVILHQGDTKSFPYPICIGLECKKPGGRPSADQLFQQRVFRLHNHIYEFVRSLDDVKKLGL